MPARGQILTDPTNGNTYEFLDTGMDTKGQYIALKATIKSRGPLVPRHYHTLQEETFEVISGKLTIWLDGTTRILSAGEKISLLKGVPHNHFNNEDKEVSYIHTVAPALDFDYLIENLVGLAADGKSKNGKYGLIQELVTLKYLDSKSYLAEIPAGLQTLLMNLIAPIGRLFGYRAVYKKYSGIEK
jgi:quercetin dioxygenase-like cupin family protein